MSASRSGAGTAGQSIGKSTELEDALREHFGFGAFRPLQKEIIAEALAGRSVIGILPTGSGKSVCYQLPALLLEGITIVISPLISLMKDQVDGLLEHGIAALALSSHDTAAEYRQKLDTLLGGSVRLLFVAPERLGNEGFLGVCTRLSVRLLAVDEAHCVSQWGHDFRPEYRQIPEFRARIGNPPVMALTATAQPRVQADLAKGLGIPDAQLYKASIDRPNLWIGMEHCETQAERRAVITRLLLDMENGSAVVYATSRADTEDLAEHLHQRLQAKGSVACYHAGMSAESRTAVQNRFMNGFIRVVVATNAFGMGIDKPDIRLVIHAGVPDSMEAYFQEIGRAGRDGLPARCIMVLLPGSDVKRREFLIKDNTDRLAQERFRQVRTWVWLDDRCRRSWLLQYFGDPAKSLPESCCSWCHPLTITDRASLAKADSGRDRKKKGAKALAALDAAGGKAGRKSGDQNPGVRRLSEDLAQLLFEELRQWRADKALAAEVPNYVIFGDRDLMGIALAAPRSLDELAACRGVGPHKLTTHGAAILGIVAPFLSRLPPPPPDSAETAAKAATETAETTEPKPSRIDLVRRTAQLFAAGTTLEAITLELDRSTATVWQYLADWVASAPDDSWKPVPLKLLGREGYQTISAAFAAVQYREGPLKPVYEALGGRFSWNQLRLAQAVWLYRDQRGPRTSPPPI